MQVVPSCTFSVFNDLRRSSSIKKLRGPVKKIWCLTVVQNSKKRSSIRPPQQRQPPTNSNATMFGQISRRIVPTIGSASVSSPIASVVVRFSSSMMRTNVPPKATAPQTSLFTLSPINLLSNNGINRLFGSVISSSQTPLLSSSLAQQQVQPMSRFGSFGVARSSPSQQSRGFATQKVRS